MANYIVQKESLEIVADSIRAKTGVSEKLEFPYGYKAAVDGIQSGGNSGGGNGSPIVIDHVVNIGAAVSVAAEVYDLPKTHALYNGVRLPKIPEDVLAQYPYAWIRNNTTSGYYDLLLNEKPFYYQSPPGLYEASGLAAKPWYRVAIATAETATAWTDNTSANSYTSWGLDSARTVLWSNHDIRNGSATATDIYFYGSEPVPTD